MSGRRERQIRSRDEPKVRSTSPCSSRCSSESVPPSPGKNQIRANAAAVSRSVSAHIARRRRGNSSGSPSTAVTASPSSAAATRSCQSVHIVSANGASSHPDQPRTSAAAIAAAQSARRKAVKSMLPAAPA